MRHGATHVHHANDNNTELVYVPDPYIDRSDNPDLAAFRAEYMGHASTTSKPQSSGATIGITGKVIFIAFMLVCALLTMIAIPVGAFIVYSAQSGSAIKVVFTIIAILLALAAFIAIVIASVKSKKVRKVVFKVCIALIVLCIIAKIALSIAGIFA